MKKIEIKQGVKMNYELKLLHNLQAVGNAVSVLRRSARILAQHSYDTFGYRNGTLGQIAEIGGVLYLAEGLSDLWQTVKKALLLMPCKLRVLLMEVHVRHVAGKSIAEKYLVSPSTVYRKLSCARGVFREKLAEVGLSEEQFHRVLAHLSRAAVSSEVCALLARFA